MLHFTVLLPVESTLPTQVTHALAPSEFHPPCLSSFHVSSFWSILNFVTTYSYFLSTGLLPYFGFENLAWKYFCLKFILENPWKYIYYNNLTSVPDTRNSWEKHSLLLQEVYKLLSKPNLKWETPFVNCGVWKDMPACIPPGWCRRGDFLENI